MEEDVYTSSEVLRAAQTPPDLATGEPPRQLAGLARITSSNLHVDRSQGAQARRHILIAVDDTQVQMTTHYFMY
jgi:hypothetical protein